MSLDTHVLVFSLAIAQTLSDYEHTGVSITKSSAALTFTDLVTKKEYTGVSKQLTFGDKDRMYCFC